MISHFWASITCKNAVPSLKGKKRDIFESWKLTLPAPYLILIFVGPECIFQAYMSAMLVAERAFRECTCVKGSSRICFWHLRRLLWGLGCAAMRGWALVWTSEMLLFWNRHTQSRKREISESSSRPGLQGKICTPSPSHSYVTLNVSTHCQNKTRLKCEAILQRKREIAWDLSGAHNLPDKHFWSWDDN